MPAHVDLGRYALGQAVPLQLATADPLNRPVPQTTLPTATVYGPSGAVVAVANLAPADRARPPYLFRASLVLGPAYAGLGTFLVVYRYAAGTTAGLATASFAAVGGGDPGGRVISLYCLDRPEARYVLGQLSAGQLVGGRNPHF